MSNSDPTARFTPTRSSARFTQDEKHLAPFSQWARLGGWVRSLCRALRLPYLFPFVATLQHMHMAAVSGSAAHTHYTHSSGRRTSITQCGCLCWNRETKLILSLFHRAFGQWLFPLITFLSIPLVVYNMSTILLRRGQTGFIPHEIHISQWATSHKGSLSASLVKLGNTADGIKGFADVIFLPMSQDPSFLLICCYWKMHPGDNTHTYCTPDLI